MSRPVAPSSLLRRLFAAGAAALVLFLALASASPDLHAWMHDGTVDSDDHCAITQFSAGVTPNAPPLVVAAPPVAETEIVALTQPELFLTSPRYLRQPERGPPVG